MYIHLDIHIYIYTYVNIYIYMYIYIYIYIYKCIYIHVYSDKYMEFCRCSQVPRRWGVEETECFTPEADAVLFVSNCHSESRTEWLKGIFQGNGFERRTVCQWQHMFHTMEFEGFVLSNFRTLRDPICTTSGSKIDCVRQIDF